MPPNDMIFNQRCQIYREKSSAKRFFLHFHLHNIMKKIKWSRFDNTESKSWSSWRLWWRRRPLRLCSSSSSPPSTCFAATFLHERTTRSRGKAKDVTDRLDFGQKSKKCFYHKDYFNKNEIFHVVLNLAARCSHHRSSNIYFKSSYALVSFSTQWKIIFIICNQ